MIISRVTFRSSDKNLKRFNHLLETEHPLVSPEFQTAFQTFKTYQSYIKIHSQLITQMVPSKELIIKLRSLSVLPLDIVVSITLNLVFSWFKI